MRAKQFSSHKLSHSTAPRFSCTFPDCNVSCSTRQHLNIHQQIHSNPKTYTVYQIPICPMIDPLVHRLSPLFGDISQETFVTSTHNRRTHSIATLPLSFHRKRLSRRLHNPIKADPTHCQTPYRSLLLQ